MSTSAQWAGTTSVDFSLAQLVQVIALLDTGGLNGGGYMASKYVVLAIYGHTRLNEQPPHPVPRMVRPSRSILEYRRYK